MTQWIFKLLRPSELAEATNNPDYPGSSADRSDGFVHFSTIEQLQGTANKHFADVGTVHLLAFAPDHWPESLLKWEPSRGGELFPHLYAPLDIKLAADAWALDRPQDGTFDFSVAKQWTEAND